MNHSTTWSTIPFVLRANSLMQSAQFIKDEVLWLSVRFRIENSVSIALKKIARLRRLGEKNRIQGGGAGFVRALL